MEAKDTVMSDEQILAISQITRENLIEGDNGYLTTRCNIAKAQAEISFKAGIKEVVEWVIQNAVPVIAEPGKVLLKLLDGSRTNALLLDIELWKDQLKEWER